MRNKTFLFVFLSALIGGTTALALERTVASGGTVPRSIDTPLSPAPPPAPLPRDEISTSRQNAITRVVARCAKAVVGITVTEVRTYQRPGLYDPFGFFQNDPYFRQFATPRTYKQEIKELGSGFIISPDGYIVTNDHVAGNAAKITVTMLGGKKYDAKIIGTDHATDVALLKIDEENLPYLSLGNSDDVLVGEWSIAFGNPFGFFESNDHPTVTVGVISNMNVNLQPVDNRSYRGMIQTDAAINHGNSGGPLVDADGEVIGMNATIFSPNDANVGIGFAIPSNRVKSIVEVLKRGGKIDRKFALGFRYQQLDDQVAQYFHLDRNEGLVVTQVATRSAANKADIQPGDIIVEAQGERIRTEDDFESIVLVAKAGDELKLKVYRDGNYKTLTMTLEPMQ